MKTGYLAVLLVTLFLVGCAAEQPSAPKEVPAAGGDADAPSAGEEAAEAPAPDGAEVGIGADAFDPVEVTVAVGGTVTWTNNDERKHVVGGSSRIFSEKLDPEASFSYTFEEAGEYTITDVLAPVFQGKVIVE